MKKPVALTSYQKAILVLLPLCAFFVALISGRMSITLPDTFKTLANIFGAEFDVTRQTETVIITMRLPRILLAMLTGAGLSVAGCAFQSLFANPLATPDTLGVAGGSAFGAALAILLGFNLQSIQLTALIFGLAAVLLTYLAGSGSGRGMVSMILGGIMIGSLFSSLISLIKTLADTETQLPAITYWLMGSFGSANYASLKIGAPLIIGGIVILFLMRWRLNILPLSEDEARSLGTNIGLLRIITVLCAAAITAASVSMCGQVGWVGLLVPHMCRMRLGNDHTSLLPACISVGACFMVLTDTLARSIISAEIPISVLTAVIGAPFFIYLMRRNGGISI